MESESGQFPAGNYKFTLSIGGQHRQEENFSIPEDLGVTELEWRHLPASEREKALDIAWKDWIGNFLDGGFTLASP